MRRPSCVSNRIIDPKLLANAEDFTERRRKSRRTLRGQGTEHQWRKKSPSDLLAAKEEVNALRVRAYF